MNTKPTCSAARILGAALICGNMAVLAGTMSNVNRTISAPAEVVIPTSDGDTHGILFHITVKKPSSSWLRQINAVYLPQTGSVWMGAPFEAHQAMLHDRFFSFNYESGGNERLLVAVSTNRYESNLKDTSAMLQAELDRYTDGRGRHSGDPCYTMRLVELLGPSVLYDRRGPKIDGWPVDEFSMETRPSRFQGLTVEGTNAVVVAIEFGTNMLAKIAFDKNVRPVWATTNGVSIGIIPTNCVFYSDIVSNKVVTTVVY